MLDKSDGVLQEVSVKVDRCEIIYIIKLDFPGAFHTVSHGRLIHAVAGEAEKGPF